MSRDRYSLSFTAASLYINPSIDAAKLYLETNDWDLVKSEFIRQNILQSRTTSALRRTTSELIPRLQTLSTAELQFFVECSPSEQGYILWIAICRRYAFIADLTLDVLADRVATLMLTFDYADFDAFYQHKALQRQELDEVSYLTKRKLRQVVFRMLREAGLLTKKNDILEPILSGRFIAEMSQGPGVGVSVLPSRYLNSLGGK